MDWQNLGWTEKMLKLDYIWRYWCRWSLSYFRSLAHRCFRRGDIPSFALSMTIIQPHLISNTGDHRQCIPRCLVVDHVDSFLSSRPNPSIFVVFTTAVSTFFTARPLSVCAVVLDRCSGARCLAAHPPDGGTRMADLSLSCCCSVKNS